MFKSLGEQKKLTIGGKVNGAEMRLFCLDNPDNSPRGPCRPFFIGG